jgi:hypothetical protein
MTFKELEQKLELQEKELKSLKEQLSKVEGKRKMGLNNFLQVNTYKPSEKELTAEEASKMIPEYSGDQIAGGIMRSAKNLLVVNWNTGKITASYFLVNKKDGSQAFKVDTDNGWVHVGPDQPQFDKDPNVSLYAVKNTNSYHAINVYNTNHGEYVSTDILAINDTDDPFGGYVDLGINGTGWDDPDYAVFDAGSGFVYCIDNNFYVGTAGSSPHKLYFFTGGVDSKDLIRGFFDENGLSLNQGLNIKEGTDARMGVATLSGGTVTVNNATITADTRIFLTAQSPSGGIGALYVSARSVGTSFTITSTSATDASTVAYLLLEPVA